MLRSLRQFTCTRVSGRQFFKASYKTSTRGDYSRCLATWNSCTQHTELTKEVKNQVPRRWSSSQLSEGLSHHYHEGPPMLEMTVGQLLASAAEKWPNRDCIVSTHQGVRLTFKQVLHRADKLAAGLLKLGLNRGDRVGLWGPNEIEWFVSFMAITRAGFIMVGINPAYRQSEIDYCLQKIGARAVITPLFYRGQDYPKMLLKSKEQCPNLEHIIVYNDQCLTGTRRLIDVEGLPNNAEVQAIAAMQNEVSPYDGCNIQFTSGTTGKPKATLLSHRSFINNSRQGAQRSGLMDEYHKICLNVPFFHAFGMVMAQFAILHSGATVVLESAGFNPKASVETIMREKCTVCYGTPTMWINLLDARSKLQAPISTIKQGTTGGSPMSPDLMKRIRNEFRFDRMQNIYGLTETTAIIFQTLPGDGTEFTDNTVGHLSDNVEAMVVDENGSPVPVGTPGELWIRGYCLMMKYWDDEINTKKTINEDGWLKTGDQFVMRPDGYGQIVGRLKDMIIRGGENIFPSEIESFLQTHPCVSEAHVFGVHDDVYGEEICACVRLFEGTRLDQSSLQGFCKGQIAHFKIPRYIQFLDSFPRTTSGKIQKFKMREDLEGRGVIPQKPQV